MIKGIVTFLMIWAFVSVGISVFRSMAGKEQWKVVKVIAYSGVTALVATGLVLGMIVLF